jgi:hypothetical protein
VVLPRRRWPPPHGPDLWPGVRGEAEEGSGGLLEDEGGEGEGGGVVKMKMKIRVHAGRYLNWAGVVVVAVFAVVVKLDREMEL